MRSAPIVLVTLLLSLAACGKAPEAVQSASVAPMPTCPDTVPSGYPAGPASPMVPGTPAEAVNCHYAGRNITTPKGSLTASEKVADVDKLVKALNAANTMAPTMIYNCPLDDASTDVLIFGYPTGQPRYVTVKPTGCATATNGKDKAWLLTADLLDQLRS